MAAAHQVVLPGDPIPSTSSAASTILGPGLLQPASSTDVISTKAGILGHQFLGGGGNKKGKAKLAEGEDAREAGADGRIERWWIEGRSRRYIPSVGEPVLGVVTARHSEGYRVDIGSSQTAALDALSFEGATKRSKPNLKVGSLVYARVSLAHPFAEPEIECVDQTTQKSQGYGELEGGMLIRNLEAGKCRELLSQNNPLLLSLGANYAFEIATGMNGRVWVKSKDVERTIELVQEIAGR